MKRLDPKSPEFRDLVRNTINIRLDLPPLKISSDKGKEEMDEEVVITKPIISLPPLKQEVQKPQAKTPEKRKPEMEEVPIMPKISLPPLKKAVKEQGKRKPEMEEVPITSKVSLPPLKQAVKTVEKRKQGTSLPPLATALKSLPKIETPKLKKKQSPKQKSPPRPVEYVDAFAATVELTDLLGTIREAFNLEMSMFGERGMLYEPLRQLANEVVREKNMYEKTAERDVNTTIPIEVYLEMLNHWKREIKYLIDKQNNLGRRCKNSEDPISLVSIDSLDNSHYIRLESGECWEFDSLLDYIQNYTRGQNDASKLKNYSSNKIWQDQTELNRILKHPLAVKSGFSAWFNSRTHSESANKVSEKTLRLMAWAASLLSSRGNDFRAALDKELDTKQREEMRKAGGNIYNVRDEKIMKEIQFTVATTLKSMAVAEFFKYYSDLSKDEKDAILSFDPSFERNVVLCNKGEFCVFGMADQLLSTRNTIAQIKKLPIVDLGNRFD